MNRSTGIASRLLFATVLASAVVFSSAGVAAARAQQCTPDGNLCTYVTGSGYTVSYQQVTVYGTQPACGYVHVGYSVNGSWIQTDRLGPWCEPSGAWAIFTGSSRSAGTYTNRLPVYLYAWWERTSGGNPGNGYVAKWNLPM
jgi:hypothetical protein